MTGIEIGVTIALGIIAICVIVAYWPLIITAIAIWAAYDQYEAHGGAGDYTLIFICWSIAFIVLSKLFGLPFGDGGYEDGEETLADRDKRETDARAADFHRREFNKRF